MIPIACTRLCLLVTIVIHHSLVFVVGPSMVRTPWQHCGPPHSMLLHRLPVPPIDYYWHRLFNGDNSKNMFDVQRLPSLCRFVGTTRVPRRLVYYDAMCNRCEIMNEVETLLRRCLFDSWVLIVRALNIKYRTDSNWWDGLLCALCPIEGDGVDDVFVLWFLWSFAHSGYTLQRAFAIFAFAFWLQMLSKSMIRDKKTEGAKGNFW